MEQHLPEGTTLAQAREAFSALGTSTSRPIREGVAEALEALDEFKRRLGEERFKAQSLALFRKKYETLLGMGFEREETDSLAEGDTENERD